MISPWKYSWSFSRFQWSQPEWQEPVLHIAVPGQPAACCQVVAAPVYRSCSHCPARTAVGRPGSTVSQRSHLHRPGGSGREAGQITFTFMLPTDAKTRIVAEITCREVSYHCDYSYFAIANNIATLETQRRLVQHWIVDVFWNKYLQVGQSDFKYRD